MTLSLRPKPHSRPKVERILQRYRMTPSLYQIVGLESGRLLRIFIEFLPRAAGTRERNHSEGCARRYLNAKYVLRWICPATATATNGS